jgi:predicted nucleic acid-binding protein
MAGVTYILDTNVISDLLKRHTNVYSHLKNSLKNGDTVCIPQPVYYEVLRGLLWVGASAKQSILERDFLPLFRQVALVDDDWRQAARYWADSVSKGRQLADVDLLVAAVATRLDAVIVSSDDDFDALPVRRVDWRELPLQEG